MLGYGRLPTLLVVLVSLFVGGVLGRYQQACLLGTVLSIFVAGGIARWVFGGLKAASVVISGSCDQTALADRLDGPSGPWAVSAQRLVCE